MVSFIPFVQPAEPVVPQPRPTIESVRARIAAVDPALRVGTSAYESALVLVAATLIGQNIDRLARLTGVSREQVALRARRLVDNGVWQNGDTVCRWRDNPDDEESFRSDVGVAEGELCRRIDPLGQMEWAPQGYWRKHFEYVPPKEAERPQVVCYHPHVPVPEQVIPLVPDTEDEDVVEEVEAIGSAAPLEVSVGAMVASDVQPAWLGGTVPAEDTAGASWRESVVETPAELFPDAQWLG